MIVCRHWLGWLLSASGTARISSWKALLFVSSSWLSTPNGLAEDGRRSTSCSGSACGTSGLDGNSRSSWSHPEPWLTGLAPAFGCIGGGFHEPSQTAAESL